MRNLDQIRAAAALQAINDHPEIHRPDVAGFPGMILQNGILAAFAFAIEEEKNSRAGLKLACEATARHLGNPLIGIGLLDGTSSAKQMLERLSGSLATAEDLQRASQEALAFFAYVKRFAPKSR